MPDDSNRKELTARLDSDLYESLREATYNLRISKQQAMTDALRMWLRSISSGVRGEAPHPDSHIPPDLRPVLKWLADLWEQKGTPEQEGLKSSLKALAAGAETNRKGQVKSAP